MNEPVEAGSDGVDAPADNLNFTMDELGAFADPSEMTLRDLHDAFRIRSLEMLPCSTSGLRLAHDDGSELPVYVPPDPITGLTVLIKRNFEADLVAFAGGVTN